MGTHGTAEVGCYHKKRIPNFARARVEARNMTRRFSEPMEPYRCRHCGGWHVGHTTLSVKRQLKEV